MTKLSSYNLIIPVRFRLHFEMSFFNNTQQWKLSLNSNREWNWRIQNKGEEIQEDVDLSRKCTRCSALENLKDLSG